MKMAAMFGVALALAVVLATVNALPKHNVSTREASQLHRFTFSIEH